MRNLSDKDRMELNRNETNATGELGLRRFSILSMSSTNLSLLEMHSEHSDTDLKSQNSRETENSDAGLKSPSSTKKGALVQTDESLVACGGINVVPDIKIDYSASSASSAVDEVKKSTMSNESKSNMVAIGLLSVEPSFIRSSDAIATLSQENKLTHEVSEYSCSGSLETNESWDGSRNISSHEALSSTESADKRLPTQSSVCSINIESCSTDDNQSESEIDPELLHTRRNSLSVLNLPERLVSRHVFCVFEYYTGDCLEVEESYVSFQSYGREL